MSVFKCTIKCVNFFQPLQVQLIVTNTEYDGKILHQLCSENYICTLFENKVDSYLKKISVRGNTMSLQF